MSGIQINRGANIGAAVAAVETAKKAVSSKRRVFQGPFADITNLLTPSGKVVSFVQGICGTEDQEVIAFLEGEKQITDVTKEWGDADVPAAPVRKRNRNWATADRGEGEFSTQISPAELLQRAAANTTHVVQAGDSNSQG